MKVNISKKFLKSPATDNLIYQNFKVKYLNKRLSLLGFVGTLRKYHRSEKKDTSCLRWLEQANLKIPIYSNSPNWWFPGDLLNPWLTSSSRLGWQWVLFQSANGQKPGNLGKNHSLLPAPSNGWCLNPTGLLNRTPYHQFGTPWSVPVYYICIYIYK